MRIRAWFLLANFMFLFCASGAHATLQGTEAILKEIKGDANQGFVNVKGKTWRITDDEKDPVSIKIIPEGAFVVTPVSGLNNTFDVTLDDPAILLNELGEISALVFQRLSMGTPPKIPESDEVGVGFVTSTDAPLEYQKLERNPRVSDLDIEINPSLASITRKEGNKVFFKRHTGYGFTAITVTLKFKLNGTSYSYPANLPTRDDGYELRWIPYRSCSVDFGSSIPADRQFGGDTRSAAREAAYKAFNQSIHTGCNRRLSKIRSEENSRNPDVCCQ